MALGCSLCFLITVDSDNTPNRVQPGSVVIFAAVRYNLLAATALGLLTMVSQCPPPPRLHSLLLLPGSVVGGREGKESGLHRPSFNI